MSNKQLTLSDKLAKTRTQLSAKRTLMAAERSLMAWIRTALSMIGFGFTIYAFLESVMSNVNQLNIDVTSPRRIGMVLLSMGIVSIIFGSVQYLISIREIQKITHIKGDKFPLLIALLIGVLGIILFIALFVKIHFL